MLFITKKEFEKFKKDLHDKLFADDKLPVGRCYWKEIPNIKERLDRIENELDELLGEFRHNIIGGWESPGMVIRANGDIEYNGLVTSENSTIKIGKFKELLNYLGIEYVTEKEKSGYKKIKKHK